jgi:hypothetical protein
MDKGERVMRAMGKIQIKAPIPMKVSDVLKKVKENLAQHRCDYQEAVRGYRVAAEKALTKAAVDIEALAIRLEETPGEAVVLKSVYFDLRIPENHEDDYNQVLEMLGMCSEKTIQMDPEAFACFCQDRWDWKDEFAATSASYSSL